LQNNHRQSLSFIDIENIGGKAGILNKSIKEKFGRLIFLAHNKLQEVIFKKFYFDLIDYYRQQEEEIFIENCLMGRNKVGVSPNTNDQQLTTNPSCNSQFASCTLQPVLEIDSHRPDRIIFMGKNIAVTAKEFSLLYLLAQNRGKILIRNDLLDTIWKENEYATYTQITYHLYKIRRAILKIIGNNKKNKEKVKDILKVVSIN
jgi:hypothetical protein